ncbi:MAG: DNA adenine methylase, partial [Anaerolinea sp.]|nr:DNA adenine methylase [Anaerolinea sp.]
GSFSQPVAELVEPFAGGGIIGLTAAFEHLAERVVLVERDPQVAAVWHTIFGEDAAWLAAQIEAFELTPQSVEALLASSPVSTRERAFQTIVKNRVNRGGILAPGAGRVKTGENGKGLTSRWYPRTLSRRIRDIASIRERVQFIEGDGLEIIRQRIDCPEVVFFIDPPYTAGGKRAGHRLYTYSDVDHATLFALTASLSGDFLMTYDDAPDVHDLALAYGFATRKILMKNTHHTHMFELLIGRDFIWL